MSNLAPRRYRAPQEDGAALIDPGLDQVADLLADNRRTLARGACEIEGLRLPELAAIARQELVVLAERYTTTYLGASPLAQPVETLSQRPLIISGHQPELFHGGVWFKNFLLSSLSERHGATAINLIVDSDLARQTTIAVPERRGELTAVGAVPLDGPAPATPYEERSIVDPSTFWAFPTRVCEQMHAVAARESDGSPRLVSRLWKHAREITARSSAALPLGLVLAQARHSVEREAGLSTLELPLSQLCGGRTFRLLAIHLLRELPKLWDIYNDSLAAYRLANRIRSAAHPVPNLAQREEWLEVPLHVWTKDNPVRRHCFLRRTKSGVVLSDLHNVELVLDLTTDGPADRALEQWAAAESRGIKVRPRALVTTLFARLLLSDLFIHGIGGAKYDELTDEIMRRWLGIEPPRYLTASATFRLPLDVPQVSREDVLHSAQLVRDVRFRPESLGNHPLVRGNPAVAQEFAARAAEKRDYLQRHALRKATPEVYRGFERIQQSLVACLEPVATALREEHARRVEDHARTRRLSSREFSFALFRFDCLVPRLLELCKLPA
jgi:hypothetical protein